MATRKIETSLALSGEPEFNRAMKSVNDNLAILKSEMNLVSAEFADNEDSVEALTAKQKVLEATEDQTRAKSEALAKAAQEAADAYGENSAKADKYRAQANQAAAATLRAEQATRKNAEALQKAQAAAQAEAEATAKATAEAQKYTPVTQRAYKAVSDKSKEASDKIKKLSGDLKDNANKVSDTAHHTPVLAEALDVLAASGNAAGKGIALTAKAAKAAAPAVKALGKAGVAVGKSLGHGAATGLQATGKGIASLTKASVLGAGALATAGVAALGFMASSAKEAAAAAKAAKEAGEPLTATQEKWLAYSDQLGSLDQSVASAKAALGGVLLPVLSKLSSAGAKFLGDFAADMEAAGTDSKAQTKVMADYIKKGAEAIKAALPEYVAIGKDILRELGGGLAESGPDLLDTMADLIMDLLDTVIDIAPSIADGAVELIGSLVQGLTDKGPDLITGAVQVVTTIVQGLASAAPKLIPAAINMVAQLLQALLTAAPDLLLAGLELILGIISGLNAGLGDLRSQADTIIDNVKQAFADKIEQFKDVGLNIVKGIGQGITDGKEWLYNLISGWVSDITNWIKDKLQIKSPSRVMRKEVGYWMARGVGQGFIDEMAAVNREIAASINTSFKVPQTIPGSRYIPRSYNVQGTGNTINLYFTAKEITQADIDLVVDTVNRKLGEDMP